MSNKTWNKQIIRYFFLAIGGILFILYFSQIIKTTQSIWKVIQPLVIGFIMAYILNILLKKLEKVYFPKAKNKFIIRSKRTICILLSVSIIIFGIYLILKIVLPQIITTITTIATGLPKLIEGLNQWINKNREFFPAIAERLGEINLDWNNIMKNTADYATKGVGSIFNSSISFISIFTSGIINLFISLVFAFYLLAGKEKIIFQLKRMEQAILKEPVCKKLNYVFSIANDSFSSYITGQCLEAIIIGALCTFGMWIFRFPYATTIGIFVGATALIPVIGAFIGASVGMILILTINPLKAVFFLLYILILQQLENNLIYPRVVGTSVGLPGIIVFAAVIIGGGLLGIFGMMLSVPIAATLYKLLQIEIQKRLNEKI